MFVPWTWRQVLLQQRYIYTKLHNNTFQKAIVLSSGVVSLYGELLLVRQLSFMLGRLSVPSVMSFHQTLIHISAYLVIKLFGLHLAVSPHACNICCLCVEEECMKWLKKKRYNNPHYCLREAVVIPSHIWTCYLLPSLEHICFLFYTGSIIVLGLFHKDLTLFFLLYPGMKVSLEVQRRDFSYGKVLCSIRIISSDWTWGLWFLDFVL